MLRLVLGFVALGPLLLLALVGRAEPREVSPARACPRDRDGAVAILQRAASAEALDQIMVDLMTLRLKALDDAERALAELPGELRSSFFRVWPRRSAAEGQAEWELRRTAALVHVDTACALLRARLEDYRNL